MCNTAFNCFDRHVAEGRGRQTPLFYDSPVAGAKRTFTFAQLLDELATFAAVLADKGVGNGDRVVIYMPTVPEAVIAMLATARLGAVHSVVFGGFAAGELAARIDDAKPKVILSASCGVEWSRIVKSKPLIDMGMEIASYKPESCIILQRPMARAPMQSGRDFDWAELVAAARAAHRKEASVAVDATDPLFILYTSGTTVVYEGKRIGTPDAGAFQRVISEHKVSVLFTSPTALRAIKREDPQGSLIGEHHLSRLRTLFLAGERADPDTIRWAEERLGIPAIDHW